MLLSRLGGLLIITVTLTSIPLPLKPGADPAAPFADLRMLPTPAGAGSLAAQLTTSPDGRTCLSWLEPASANVMRFRLAERKTDGWDLRADIAAGNDLLANSADVPSVFVAKDGRFVAHWLQKGGGSTAGYGIRLRSSDDGGRSWTAPLVPHRDASPTEHGFVSFFDLAGGEIGMVWLDGRATGGGHGGGSGATMLRFTTLSRRAGLGPDVVVDDRVCDCCPTSAARTDRGVIVAYRDRSGKEIRDISTARFENGTWTGGGAVHADGWQIAACPVNGPAIAAHGTFVALAWFTAAGNVGRVLAAFSKDGGITFGDPVRVDDGETAGRVDVEILSDGSAIVVWIESRKGGADLRARRVFADGRRGPSTTIAPVDAGRSSGVPRVVRSKNELVFAWRSPGPSPRVSVAVASIPTASPAPTR